MQLLHVTFDAVHELMIGGAKIRAA
jgi:hypothetical protein